MNVWESVYKRDVTVSQEFFTFNNISYACYFGFKSGDGIMNNYYVRKVVFLYCAGETISTRKCKEQPGIEMVFSKISVNRSY